MNEKKWIRDIQIRQLRMLEYFDDVCKKNEIKYWASYGTLLGAVRHKGFIPWDDDTDLCMLREDYEKLKQLPVETWGEDYILLTPESDDIRHDKLFGRVYLKNSKIQSYKDVYERRNWEDNKAWHTSLMLDIFIFDFAPDDDDERDRLYEIVYKKYVPHYLISKIKPVSRNKGVFSSIKAYIKQIYASLLRMMYKEPWEVYAEKYYNLVKDVRGTRIGCYSTTYNASDKGDLFVEYDDIFPLETMQFENMMIPVPRKWDKLLHKAYDNENGDYMTLPPENERYHINFIYIDFGDGTRYVIDPVKGSLGDEMS